MSTVPDETGSGSPAEPDVVPESVGPPAGLSVRGVSNETLRLHQEATAQAVAEPMTRDVAPGVPQGIVLGAEAPRERPAGDSDEVKLTVQGTEEGLEALQRALTIFTNPATPAARRDASLGALLDALSGGYEPEVRLQILATLIGSVDANLHSLLVAHLEDIRSETMDLGQEELAQAAERLLTSLGAMDE